MSKYSPIWNHLKEHGSVSLAIPIKLQPRVIKGVIHAKDHDLVRKLELSEIRKKEKIEYVQESARVTITLVVYDNLKEIQLSEL